ARVTEPRERQGALGRRLGCAGGREVRVLLAVDLDDGGGHRDVVEGGDADDVLPDAGGAGGPGARGTAVADRGDHDDAGVDEVVARHRGRVLRPGGERRADALVDDVHAVRQRP